MRIVSRCGQHGRTTHDDFYKTTTFLLTICSLRICLYYVLLRSWWKVINLLFDLEWNKIKLSKRTTFINKIDGWRNGRKEKKKEVNFYPWIFTRVVLTLIYFELKSLNYTRGSRWVESLKSLMVVLHLCHYLDVKH